MAIDYEAIARAGGLSKDPRQQRKQDRKTDRTAAGERQDITKLVFERQGYVCFAKNIGARCLGDCWDRHELIPRGLGGKVTLDNCVGLCRHCHRDAQNAVGGTRLVFTWVGKRRGKLPRASLPGNVTVKVKP